MSATATRSSTWLDGLGEWAWPGMAPAVEPAPAAWIPSTAARVEPVGRRLRADPAPGARHGLARPLRLARLVALLAIGALTFLASGGFLAAGSSAVAVPLRIAPALVNPFAAPSTTLADAVAHPTPALGVLAPALPAPVTIATDRAGSSVASITYPSQALGWRDRFLVYLPPGYHAGAARRYPVLYLLHGAKQSAASFLRLGVQPTLDRLISSHRIAPMIAVMLAGNGLTDNWRNTSGPQYFNYVGEVQRLTDRVLPTIPDRASRGVAGYSMGGYGAMHVALTQLRRYGVVESWEGFFNHLSDELASDRRLLARLPLHAFVYGGLQDTVADPSEDVPWAAAMRAAGADASAALYAGDHSFAPLERHLAQMLTFAGRALAS